jgi:hypothetical protein
VSVASWALLAFSDGVASALSNELLVLFLVVLLLLVSILQKVSKRENNKLIL